MAGSTKAQQMASIDRQTAFLKLRREVIDAKEKYQKVKSALKSARDKARG